MRTEESRSVLIKIRNKKILGKVEQNFNFEVRKKKRVRIGKRRNQLLLEQKRAICLDRVAGIPQGWPCSGVDQNFMFL
jgi:hypothetical protein